MKTRALNMDHNRRKGDYGNVIDEAFRMMSPDRKIKEAVEQVELLIDLI